MASARTSAGNAISTSSTRMMIASVIPPQYPAAIPSRPPTTRPMAVTPNPTSNETLPPYRMREKMSLPTGSVPKMWPGDSGGRP